MHGTSVLKACIVRLKNNTPPRYVDSTNARKGNGMVKLTLEERIAQLEARKQALKARLGKQERAIDTRRKVLLGAMLLDAIERARTGQGRPEDRDFAVMLEGWIARELPSFLKRPIDRTLFSDFIKSDEISKTETEQ